MDTISELIRKHPVDHPLALHSGGPFESRRDDLDAEMRLSLRARANMSGVQVGLIDDVETVWRERVGQLGLNRICDTHISIHIE